MKHKLSASGIKALPPGLHADGDGLYLRVSATGSKTWTFIYVRKGKRTELGLGRLADVPLAVAREKTKEFRQQLAGDVDPKAARAAIKGIPTLQEALAAYTERYGDSRHERTVQRWQSLLRLHAKNLLNVRCDKVSVNDVATVVGRLWPSPTASLLLNVIERLLDFVKVTHGLKDMENVARWKGNVEHLMDTHKEWAAKHHAAMPWSELPAFWRKLMVRDTNAARLLCFQILTATRPSEPRLMRWSEIDWEARIWTIPAARMKMRKQHSVPLSDVAMDILRFQAKAADGQATAALVNDRYVFPGSSKDGCVSPMATRQTMAALDCEGLTGHGFRSSFRDWGAEATDFDESLLERCLAHAVVTGARAAYERTELVEKRRPIMQAWAGYVTDT